MWGKTRDKETKEAAKEADVKAITLSLLGKLLPEERPFAVRLWDGTVLPSSTEPPKATLVIQGSDTMGRVLEPPLDLAAGEAYIRGDLDIEGDHEAVFEVIETFGPRLSPLDWVQLAQGAASLRRHAGLSSLPLGTVLRGRKHSKERDQQAVQHHYDISNRFYELLLDPRLIYSCAYFPTGDETLADAQTAKLELLCRKLRLKPGERLLDIGCGWGGLAIYAAQNYGVEVVGVTLSQKQLDEGRNRVEQAGLSDKIELELRHYRDIEGDFDKIVSVGMSEHVGGEQLPEYFKTAFDHLKPGGLMLNHAISQGSRANDIPTSVISGELSERYIFPDGEIIPIWQTLKTAEETGFEVRDVEDLREHYAKTLRFWAQNLDTNWDAMVAEVGTELARLRRFHLSAAALQFAYGHVALHQALLAKPDAVGGVKIPPSRDDIYA